MQYKTTSEDNNQRIDVVLTKRLGHTRSHWQKQIKLGCVTLDAVAVKPGHLLQAGQILEIQEPAADFSAPVVPIVYEDDYLVVLNKPAGLLVHPTATSREGTVSHYTAGITTDTDRSRPGIVHRLDRNTSGLLIVAKDVATKAYLQKLFKLHDIRKTYLALVTGHLDAAEATVDLPIGRSLRSPAKRAVTPIGRKAITHYKVIQEWPGYSLIEINPETGRTHQIRVHFAHLGHPVVGDDFYGNPREKLGLERHFLHAYKLDFVGPDGKKISLECPLPAELETVLANLNKRYG